MRLTLAIVFSIAILAIHTPAARSAMYITEWAYQGNGGEFMEFTNTGGTPVDMTGWSFDDNTQTAGSVSLSAFGVVAPGESVILADITAAAFRTEWGLPASVKVIGENTQNLGRADEINLFDNTNALADRLTYDDQTLGGPRTNLASGNPKTLAVLGANNVTQWVLSTAGDAYGSYLSVSGAQGNPGKFTLVPEPGMFGLIAMLIAGGCVQRRVTSRCREH